MALIAQAATLEARVPFLHFFDGFRTSHEVDQDRGADRRRPARDDRRRTGAARTATARLTPDRPVIRGTAQNPDVFFQAPRGGQPVLPGLPRASSRRRWTSSPASSGRQYHLFDYVGAPDAERVIVMMGSGAETAQETVEYLTRQGEKVGLLKVRLYRPFSVEHFVAALPPIGQAHRRARPHEGARRRWRAALPGRRHRAGRSRAGRTAKTARHRRPLRPVVQGIHAGDGQGRLRRDWPRPSRRTTSPSASSTT